MPCDSDGTSFASSERSDGRGAMDNACVYTVGYVGDCGSEGTVFCFHCKSRDGAVRVLLAAMSAADGDGAYAQKQERGGFAIKAGRSPKPVAAKPNWKRRHRSRSA